MQHESVKVLAVDDVEENLTALEALLKEEGVELIKARSGPQALELLLLHDVALALLDVQMPVMDGFELAELMRGTERTRRVPIIFLTAVATDEGRRFRGYEAGAVDYLLKPVNANILRNKVRIFAELFQYRQELARQRDDNASALARLHAHRDNSPLAIVELDAGQHIIGWWNGAERMFGWRAAEVAGFKAREIGWLDPQDEDVFADMIENMIGGGRPRTMEVLRMRTAEGISLDCECYCSALLDGRGRLVSVNVQILDVTERKRAEDTQKLLIGELNHRVKNTLASVQAIAMQTLRHSSGPSDFAPTFTGRIHALARAHSLLSNSTWQGAGLRELIDGQIDIGTINPEQLVIEGLDLNLAPELALHLAMILHELVTNAHKYGALSMPEGVVSLIWSASDDQLVLRWTERGGPPVQAPSRRGFGTALIERSLKAEGGSAVPDYAVEGIGWTLTLPHRSRTIRSGAEDPARYGASAETSISIEALRGSRFIVIEDEPLVTMEIANLLEDAGATIVATAATEPEALVAIEGVVCDAALLDGNLQGELVDKIADALSERNIPFLFVTGYGRDHLPAAFAERPLILKPFNAAMLLAQAAQLLAAEPDHRSHGIERPDPAQTVGEPI
ncbi:MULTISPECIES: response regulator [unclassified Sphingomonas]|uniref:response regulator n=2 Tax=Sphingomonas TaxID=13687 RepID=UPI0006FAD998|nr:MULTISPECIES: response regulator [unclassified Sphingomonas]KQX20059.1 regulator [Sphingomonas sp. Root1294]KRB90684.1 regulator [Sphingomonas sp. Root720]